MTRSRRSTSPVPLQPTHRRSWRTFWRRCTCGLTAPCVDRVVPPKERPFPPRRSDVAIGRASCHTDSGSRPRQRSRAASTSQPDPDGRSGPDRPPRSAGGLETASATTSRSCTQSPAHPGSPNRPDSPNHTESRNGPGSRSHTETRSHKESRSPTESWNHTGSWSHTDFWGALPGSRVEQPIRAPFPSSMGSHGSVEVKDSRVESPVRIGAALHKGVPLHADAQVRSNARIRSDTRGSDTRGSDTRGSDTRGSDTQVGRAGRLTPAQAHRASLTGPTGDRLSSTSVRPRRRSPADDNNCGVSRGRR
jgi:hypothetical protein